MRSLVRSICFHSLTLFLLTQFLTGIHVRGGFSAFLLGGTVLAVLTIILKPILTIISFPFHLITFGLLTFLINAVILYVLTIFVKEITIDAFVFSGFSFAGFVIPKVALNTFFAYVVVSCGLSAILAFLKWLTT